MQLIKQNYLSKILEKKEQEVKELIAAAKDPSHPLHSVQKQSDGVFAKALQANSFAVIAEVKRRSPSMGLFTETVDPVKLALDYCKGGASAISILTDKEGFGGCLNDLKVVSKEVKKLYPNVAFLRKDFIIHPLQLAESLLAGASAVLLIASLLKESLPLFLEEAKRLGLETLVEVHDEKELELALKAKSPVIGINHRNLKTFDIELSLSKALKPKIPSGVLTVAESGIHTPLEAKQMRALGFNAILVGEALMRSSSPDSLIQSFLEEAL